MKILCFGDSNTYGFNPINYSQFPFPIRYAGILQDALDTNVKVVDEGICGLSIVHPSRELSAMNHIEDILKKHKEIDIITLMLGTNDCNNDLQLCVHDIGRNLEILVKKIHSMPQYFVENNVNIVIIVPAQIKPEIQNKPNYSLNLESHLKSIKLSPIYKEVCTKNNCKFIDTTNILSTSQQDYVHLDTTAHKALGNFLATKIKEFFKI